MLLGRKAEGTPIPARAGAGGGRAGVAAAPAGRRRSRSDVFDRPTDVAWDAQGNIFVADGQGNARVAKFDKDGVFVKSWGFEGHRRRSVRHRPQHRGRRAGQCLRRRRRQQPRIQVFDNNGTFKTTVHRPSAIRRRSA